MADQSIQALYRAADCETKRTQIETEFLTVARRITSMLEKEGVTTRRGHQAELLSLGKLERITRDGRQLLHFHAYVFNFGRSVESGEFGALSFKKAFDLQRYYQNILTKDFANRLITKLHFDVYRRRDNGLGIRGVTKGWIAAWKADSNQRLKSFKNTVGVRRQKLIDQFNRYSRVAKQQWNLEERLATWRKQGEKFGWYLRTLPTRTLRYLTEKQVEQLSTRYVKRAIRWESNHANLVRPSSLVASALVESLRDERVNEASIKQAITKMMTRPRKYGLDTWKVKDTEYLILLRNSQLMRQAIKRSATMGTQHHRRHKIDKKELAHYALYLDQDNTVTLNQFVTGEYLTFVPADRKQALHAIMESYASRKYRTIIVSKSPRLRPKG
ncbi:MAG TPA: relaxase domain-containing protein, partial [Gemmatales bacterium]|nr:relaxase domain-containing protein [Gemmatales bacterium]